MTQARPRRPWDPDPDANLAGAKRTTFAPGEGPKKKPNGQAEEEAVLGEWDAGEDDEPIPPRGWLLASIYCRGFTSSVIAEGGSGKTAYRIAQALALATGLPLTGEHIFLRCRVLIVSLEDTRDELRRRVRAAMKHYGISHADIKGWLFLASPGRKVGKLLQADKSGRSTEVGPLVEKLVETIKRRKIDLLILDPLVKTHSAPENDNSAMDEVIEILAGMAMELDIAVDTPHHTSKAKNPTPGDADRGRGASSVKDGARLVYTLTTMSSEEADLFGVDEGERRLHFRIDSAKVNIAPPSATATWFRLVGVPIDNPSDFYPHGDVVQSVERWRPPDVWEGLGDDLLNAALNDIAAGLENGIRYSAAGAAKKRAAWKVVQKHAPDKTAGQCREIIKAWLNTGLLYEEEYWDETERKSAKGLSVDDEKRPGRGV